MTRSLAFVLAVSIGLAIYSSTGAQTGVQVYPQNGNPLLTEFSGKVVLFDRAGWTSTISKDVRLVRIGQETFFVFPNPNKKTEMFEFWVPLNMISNIKVFENEADAISYDRKEEPLKYKQIEALKKEASLQ